MRKKINLSEIIQINFPQNQYVREVQNKKQIILHHSAGWDNARGMFAGWAKTSERVATCMGVTDPGTLFQAYSSSYWAYHLYVRSKGNKLPEYLKKYQEREHAINLERRSIGIEICNWGGLTQKEGRFYSWANVIVPDDRIIEYIHPIRGYKFYERYTPQEIDSLYSILKYWLDRYDIPYTYSGDIWETHEAALSGSAGIFSHVSFRSDKTDCHPQPDLIQMLKSL